MSLKSFLENIAKSFQPTYDKIKAWKLPPQVDKLFDEIWKELPKKIQNALWDLVKKIYDEYGEELAIALLASLLPILKGKT